MGIGFSGWGSDEANDFARGHANVETERLKGDVRRLTRAVEQLRGALRNVVGACRFDCTPESNCGVCAIALRALGETA
jgi:hypothetical protein